MDMLTGDQIEEANLTDWRKLGQGLHARCVVRDFGTGVRVRHRRG
jgi:4a-hydroxytetrahydrobiopterin dehydratase